MSLAEAVTEITNDLEKQIGHCPSTYSWIKQYVQMLRMAVKAAERPISLSEMSQAGSWGSQWQAKAREEFSNKEKAEEEAAEHMIQVVDGPYKDNLLTIASSMPIGAKTYIGSEIYQLSSDGLRHCPLVCQGDLDDMK